jgi:hypothetical protein
MTRLLRIFTAGFIVCAVSLSIGCSKKSTDSPNTGGTPPGQTPVVEAVYPPGAHPGYTVRIIGQHFGTAPGTSSVNFGGVAATQYTGWSDVEIDVTVPGAAPTEMQQTSITVTVGGKTSAPLTFYKTPDRITRITADSLDNRDPCWVGSVSICFVRYEVKPGNILTSNLWRIDPSGETMTQRTFHDSITDYPSFDKANTLAYRCKKTGYHNIYKSTGIGNETIVTTGDLKDFQPAVAPQGNYDLALSRAIDVGGGVAYEIHGWSGGFTQLTDGPQDFHPTWSKHADSLAFERWETPRGTQIYVLDVLADSATRITSLDTSYWNPDWNHAYGKIAYWRTAASGPGIGHHNIYMMNPDGSDQVAVTELRSQVESPNWSPNGKQIVYADRVANVWDIYIVDVSSMVP